MAKNLIRSYDVVFVDYQIIEDIENIKMPNSLIYHDIIDFEIIIMVDDVICRGTSQQEEELEDGKMLIIVLSKR